MSRKKGNKKMNGNELVELGNVLIQWGMMIITFGLATMLLGAILLVIGKVFFTEKTDLALAFLANILR